MVEVLAQTENGACYLIEYADQKGWVMSLLLTEVNVVQREIPFAVTVPAVPTQNTTVISTPEFLETPIPFVIPEPQLQPEGSTISGSSGSSGASLHPPRPPANPDQSNPVP